MALAALPQPDQWRERILRFSPAATFSAEAKTEEAIEHAPGDLAITDAELWALRRYLHEQVAATIRKFWQDRWQEMAKREQELAERRHEIEGRYAAKLLQKRQQLPRIDWTNPPNFEAEAAHKVHEQSLAQLGNSCNLQALLDQLAPHLYDFASFVGFFERVALSGLPPSQWHAHSERVVRAIVRMILPGANQEE